jgi:alkylation response protein AidB-like acyl-CoA dehydrogenase
MDLMLSPEEDQIVDSARALLSKVLPVEAARWHNGAAAAPDRAVFGRFAELGWLALGLPEAAGGFGFGAAEEALLFREAGRALVTPQLLATVLAARIAAAADNLALAARFSGGTSRAGLAIPDEEPGTVLLIDADEVGFLLLVSSNEVALLPADAVTARSVLRSVDETVALERAAIDPAKPGLAGGPAAALHLALLIAAQLTGSAEATRDLCVAYASERSQFGQKIATFQAVSHPLADMAVQIAAARVVALDAALTNAQAAVQIHGGMGFTAEYPLHFHLKRTHLLDRLGGTMAEQLDRCFELAA